MTATADLSLLDILPGRASGQDSERQWLRVTPDANASTTLGDDLRRLDRSQRSIRLCAALALVESHLTGATQVCAGWHDAGGPRQALVDVPRAGDVATWQRALVDALQAAGPSGPGAWCAGVDAAHIADDDAVSVWSLGLDDEPVLHVGVRAPMALDAAALLARCVWRVLAAFESAQPLERIDLLDVQERQRLLVDWNDTARPRSLRDTVHGRFAAMVAHSPDAPAVVDRQRQLSYAELDREAAALAARLRLRGVVAGDTVAVAMERSVDAVVAVLGVLKAGAAYLPLDLAHPAERLAFMLDDAQARAVVVADAAAPLPIADTVVRVAAVEAPGCAVAETGETIDGDALAYVMYTSGSTGTPKGVQIRHRSILRLVCDVDYIALGPRTRMLHAAPLGFDASTLELWGALLNGGCIVVHDEALPTGAGLAATIRQHGVTTAWLTAALFNTVVDEDPQQLAGLVELFTGGEALSVDHVRRMRQAAPATKLRNGYGPTECTTFTCTHAIDGDIDADCQSIPIGRPIADTQLYVLNACREPVPTGVIGELYVGGEGVAAGYLRRPELSGDRFLPHPFVAGEQVYRTGDLVRYRADGVVEFVGRVDTQVKIRGYRIELGEIETVLARHPQVQACAVLARADGPGEKRLVAYYVADAAISAVTLRSHLAAALPEFMVPARYLRVPVMPLTANGKLDRRALPAPDRSRPDLAVAFEPALDGHESDVCEAFAAVLDLERVGRHDNFFELGGSSLLGLRLLERLRAQHGGRIAATLLFRHPTPATLAAALAGAASQPLDPTRIARGGDRDATQEPIAIVAMAGRFPGAQDVETFWRNLCDGRDTISVFAPGELDASISAYERNDPAYVPARGVIEGVEQFDAAFFGISPKEAELMDPQQRIFLELCWECLERGGHVPDAAGMPVGVFAGMYNATYFQRHVSMHPELVDKLGAFQVMLGNEKDYIATRTAHRLNLTGPAISVHTACSTSLVAICQAMDSLRAGRCDMALAGGASVTCPPRSGYRYQEGSMLSPDGHTRTFDARAQGTVFSDGAAVVLLKRLSDAVRDGNPVYAVIRGGAVNNDGGHKASFTAPSSEGQAAVIAMAHDHAGVDPRSIGYVETHGTATPLGDPIEVEGLTRAFRRGTDDVGFCRIGSVKTNIGHTVIAAGATGVIKTALALAEQRIPGNVHFQTPHPSLALDGSPFVVNGAMSDWPRGDTPRRAGVSSFGVGGTNAHVVLEEAPEAPEPEAAQGPQLLVLSARTPTALEHAAARLASHLDANPQVDLGDVAWTLAVGRKAFAHRVAVVADSLAGAVVRLRAPETVAAATRSRPARGSDVVFLFPGQGATYAGMGRALYAAQPVFRAAVDECADALADDFGFDLRERMFSGDADAMLPTAIMQPATFAIEYALARWWMSQGLVPVAMIGHSVGEFVAATLAGVFDPRDAVRLVAQRGALMQAEPAGGMLSIRAGVADVQARLPVSLSLAAENAPGASVVAGPLDDIAAFQAQLEADGIACRPLRTSHAFHSAMMDPVVAPFRDAVAAVARHAPRLPVVSTVLADWLDADTAVSADYWARHLREPVRFAGAAAKVLEERSRVLLEVGPRATLCGLVRQHPQWQKQHTACVPSLGDAPERETSDVLAAAGALWAHGVALDPAAFDRRQRRRRLLLPTYPFERQRYWVEASAPATGGNVVALASPAPAAVSTLPSLPPEIVMPSQPATSATTAADSDGRRPRLIAQLKDVFEDVAGFDMDTAESDANFIELGLDSLMLTQVALQLEKAFGVKVTFRQLMGECASLDALSAMLDAQMPADAPPAVAAIPVEAVSATPSVPAPPVSVPPTTATPAVTYAAPPMLAMPQAMPAVAADDFTRYLIAQQMQLMSQQLALLGGVGAPMAVAAPQPVMRAAPIIEQAPAPVAAAPTPVAASAPSAEAVDEEAALAHTKYDVKKAFGAIARIDNKAQIELTSRQREKLDAFMARYIARTRASKDYTQAHRPHMADPRVVNGFRPLLKEIVYQIVIQRSKGAHLVDLDGNDYVDALNGFGMSLFGWQPEFVLDAVRAQLELGYEIGPQHPLAGEVAQLACEVTGHDRAALCNTGSEAVLGALRIARTVTGRETVVLFTGSYHGIVDEMIVRGTKKLRAVPAAPGILRNTAEHVLVLDYGTPESMRIIRERASEIAAVLVEPVQSRRPDFQPRDFLHELRQVTRDAGALLVFDEVVTGFRAHPAGAQGHFGLQADLATYGKVVGGGYPIGVIAGKREFMDALDGGHWQFGDASVPTVGVTYFAGTFVRHPLALAAAKAVLTHVKQKGRALQDDLNARATDMVAELNDFCAVRGAPIEVRHFASVWKTFFLEDHPLQDLLFAMMRSRGVHILDNFPCFLTTAHSDADLRRIIDAFKESVIELQEAQFLPRHAVTPQTAMDAREPVVAGARLGRDPDGRPGWYIPDPQQPGQYLKVG